LTVGAVIQRWIILARGGFTARLDPRDLVQRRRGHPAMIAFDFLAGLSLLSNVPRGGMWIC